MYLISPAELRDVVADLEIVLALSPVQGINMNSAIEGDDIKAAQGGTHGYFPDFKEIQIGFIGSPDGILYPDILKGHAKAAH